MNEFYICSYDLRIYKNGEWYDTDYEINRLVIVNGKTLRETLVEYYIRTRPGFEFKIFNLKFKEAIT